MINRKSSTSRLEARPLMSASELSAHLHYLTRLIWLPGHRPTKRLVLPLLHLRSRRHCPVGRRLRAQQLDSLLQSTRKEQSRKPKPRDYAEPSLLVAQLNLRKLLDRISAWNRLLPRMTNRPDYIKIPAQKICTNRSRHESPRNKKKGGLAAAFIPVQSSFQAQLITCRYHQLRHLLRSCSVRWDVA